MAKKNQGAEVEAAPGSETVSNGSGAAGNEGGSGAGVPPTEEERIRQQTEAKLEERAGELVVKLSKAEALANGLQGELDRERSKAQALEAQVLDLQAQLAEANTAVKNSGTAIAGLPDNARQLNECVTIASAVAGIGKGGRLHAKAGDVVLVGSEDEFKALQQELGLRATVYRVSKATVEDLEQSGFLHP